MVVVSILHTSLPINPLRPTQTMLSFAQAAKRGAVGVSRASVASRGESMRLVGEEREWNRNWVIWSWKIQIIVAQPWKGASDACRTLRNVQRT